MTFENVSMIVPYKPDGSYREKSWNWIKKRHELLMPGIEICTGDSDISPYSRAAGINSAAKKATKDIFIIVDADLIFNINDVKKAIDMISKFYFIIPYNKLIKLNEEKTKELIQKQSTLGIDKIDTKNGLVYDRLDYLVGGMCVITRSAFESVGGYNEIFRGWGAEDNAFYKSIEYLYKNYMTRIESTLIHLYHTYSSNDKNDTLSYNNIKLLTEKYGDNQKIEKSIIQLRKNNGYDKSIK